MISEFISVLNQTKSIIWEDVPPEEWCLALYGNHDEHQCHKKPGHREKVNKLEDRYPWRHECTCGVWW